MLTLAAYLGYVRHGRSLGRYLLVAVLFALGLMAKPMLVTLPPLLLLLDFWPLARLGLADRHPGHGTRTVERPGTCAAGAGKAAPRCTGGGRLPDDAADPLRGIELTAGPLVRADRQRGGFLRHLRHAVFSIRSTWPPFIPFTAGRSAWLESGRRNRDSGRQSARPR